MQDLPKGQLESEKIIPAVGEIRVENETSLDDVIGNYLKIQIERYRGCLTSVAARAKIGRSTAFRMVKLYGLRDFLNKIRGFRQ